MSKEKISIQKPKKGEVIKVYLNSDGIENRYGIGRYMIGVVKNVKGFTPIINPVNKDLKTSQIDRFLEFKETIIKGDYVEFKRKKEDGI